MMASVVLVSAMHLPGSKMEHPVRSCKVHNKVIGSMLIHSCCAGGGGQERSGG